MENLWIFWDVDQDGYGIGTDTLVASVETLELTAGIQTVVLPDGSPEVVVPPASSRTYHVVLELAPTATAGSLVVTHVTESSSEAHDRDYDLPLSLQYSANVSPFQA